MTFLSAVGVEHLGQRVNCTLTDATVVSGYLYSVDPESHALMLVTTSTNSQTTFIAGRLLIPVISVVKVDGKHMSVCQLTVFAVVKDDKCAIDLSDDDFAALLTRHSSANASSTATIAATNTTTTAR
jgi:hypothetical protein